jgi:hypothetical protein
MRDKSSRWRPRIWISTPRSSIALSSTPATTATPFAAPAALAAATAATVSWSVTATAVRPSVAACARRASGDAEPSDAVVWA